MLPKTYKLKVNQLLRDQFITQVELHIIFERSFYFIPHNLKDPFGFLERLDATCTQLTLYRVHVILNHFLELFAMMYFAKLLFIGLKN